MASFVYAVWSITNVASVHCAVRPEISPCTCEPIYAHNYVELSCEKVGSFHQIVDALSNKFEPMVNISLKISYSQLEDLEMRSFTDMKLNVVKLRMQWNSLRSVPELPFRGLSNVEYLSIGDNELEEIPKHMLNHLPIVKTFDIGRCNIRSVLQDDLKGIQMVANLFLPSNNISRLDKGAFPTGLVTLHLGRNQIESLNGTLRDLNKLESLFINMNSISNLDDELPESNRLKLIMAQNNRLERLPESMRYMNRLENLHLQFNRLKSLDGIFKNAKNLNLFFAYNNEIEYLAQDEFQALQYLEELNLSFNKIKALNHSLVPLSRLCTANFSFNEIDEFSMNEIRGLMHLKQLDMSYNHIQKLTGRQENNIDQMSLLIEFNLDHNQLKSLDGALMGLNSLRILSLAHNKIERILPEDFIGLVRLEILELSHNQLLTLKEMETTFLPNLKILKVAYNNLTKLDRDFHGLPVLCQANLTNNQISSISADLVSETRCMNHNVPGKLELLLDENPIMCDDVLNELCPSMMAQEARIRGRSTCWEQDEEVCTVLPMLLAANLHILVQKKIVVPSQVVLGNSKPLVQLIVPAPILLNNQLRKPEEILPPLIAPMGQQIIQPIILPTLMTPPTTTTTTAATEATTTTTTTTTPTPSTTTTTTATMLNSNETTTTTPNISKFIIREITINNTDLRSAIVSTSSIIAATTPVPNTTTTTAAIPANIINDAAENLNATNTKIQKDQMSLAMPDEAPPIVLDILDDAPVSSSAAVAASLPNTSLVAATNADVRGDAAFVDTAPSTVSATVAVSHPSMVESLPQEPEYATVEYIHEFMPGAIHPPPSPDVLDEDSNSVHEEFPSVVLADLDTAPQSLLIQEEPPENP